MTALGRDLVLVEVRPGVGDLVHRFEIDDVAVFLVRVDLAGELMRELAQYQHLEELFMRGLILHILLSFNELYPILGWGTETPS